MNRTGTAEKIGIWIAQGFGSGRLRPGPGTWGTLVGCGWLALLLASGSPWIFWLGTLTGIFAAIGITGASEKWLGQHDPPSVVLDEIAAVPLTFGFLRETWGKTGGTMELLEAALWPEWCMAFVLFRFFDIAKPWPIRSLQKLPGGWGITLDDVLAALLAGIGVACLRAFR